MSIAKRAAPSPAITCPPLTNKEGKKRGAGNDTSFGDSTGSCQMQLPAWAQSVFAVRERARFVNENEITLQPPAAPAPEGWSPGPWAIVTGTRTRQTRPGNEDQ